jgi:hypothetical protein
MKNINSPQNVWLNEMWLGKSRWDWEVFLVPLMIFAGTFAISLVQIYTAQEQHDNDQQIAQDNQVAPITSLFTSSHTLCSKSEY